MFRVMWRNFRRHKLAMLSLVILVVLAFLAVFAGQIAPYDPNDIDARAAQVTRGLPQKPSSEHLLGTDNFNRDILSRALYGMRISLSVGFLAMCISIGFGVLVGAISGYAGGILDNVLMRIVDVFLSVPSFILFLALNAILKPNIWNIIIILGVFSWMDISRLVRADFISLKERDFIVAARSIGASPQRIMLSHLLPNSLGSIVVSATLAVPAAILSESALSFIGLGVPPPDASLGSMLQNAKAWLLTAWWMWAAPGVMISFIVLAFNFVGDGLRDALDPTLIRR
ncbi:MAG: ABC transporter permease [Anaerolineae bacterium]|nr:ABC transporter permease [Anaerolineae bacterium]